MSSNQEYVLTDTDLIVSKTDLKGKITYVNDDFIRIGGFSKQELIGASHSIVRHPDMPRAAFADMWKTLESGNSWTGIVKNLTRDGGFYWVHVNALPIWENNKVVGYVSVRNKPSASEIATAATLYRNMNTGKSKVKLDAGEIIPPSLTYAIRRTFNNITIKTKLITLVCVSLISLGGIGAYGSYGLGVIKTVVEKNMQEVETHAKSLSAARSTQLAFKTQIQEWKNILLRGQDGSQFTKYSKSFDDEGDKVIKKLQELNRLMVDVPEKEFVALVDVAIKSHNDLMEKYHAALKNYQVDNPATIFTVDASVKGFDRQFTDEIEKLVEFHRAEIEKHLTEGKDISKSVVQQFQTQVAIFGFLVSAALLAWSILTLLSVLKPIKNATQLIKDATEGKEIKSNDFSKNEFGEMMRAIKAMAILNDFEMSEQRILANEMTRIKMALDEVTMPVTLSNSQREFVYTNKAGVKLWKQMEAEIAKRIPDYKFEKMYNTLLSSYLENDDDKKWFSAPEKEIRSRVINLGGRTLEVTVVSIFDEQDMYIGRATQWVDKTTELALEKQISTIVAQATTGNFHGRIETQTSQAFFKQLAQGLNLLLETCEKSYGDMANIFDALARGDLTQTITNEYSGEFENIKNNANTTVYKLTEIVDQIKDITRTVNESSKEIAGSNTDLSHRTTTQASAIEETAASMHELTAMVESNTDNANKANDFVIGASIRATKGVEVISRVVSTMEDIHESSRKVVDIISVIDGISFQTNILALNAAVEAARAGEQGRGFAVVASEVRSLAQRAAAAAGEIKNLINDSVEKIEDGSKLVVDAGHTMEDIVGSIHTVTSMIGQISVASSEQSLGISQANKAIVEMEEMTQQNATLVEQSSATADNLKNQAADLSKAVDYFKIS
ncbi:MAG: methyl-accepting chemotaxis protein [Methylococcales bacterium]|nr:methyl-accepting chemotaxis protein [Methylococcales bacterium]